MSFVYQSRIMSLGVALASLVLYITTLISHITDTRSSFLAPSDSIPHPPSTFPQQIPTPRAPHVPSGPYHLAEMKTLSMPSPNDTSAPRFDAAQPRGLQHFFEELDFLFEDTGITSDALKKRYARRYTDFSTAELWQSLPEYASTASPSPSYSEFVSAVIALYPEADPRYRYSLTDLAAIISRQSLLVTQPCAQVGAYYRSFYPVAASLVAQGSLTEAKRDELFLTGFGPSISHCVKRTLETTRCISPHGSYSINDVYSTALVVTRSCEASESVSVIASTSSQAPYPSTARQPAHSSESHSSHSPSPSPSPSDQRTTAVAPRKTLISDNPNAVSPLVSLATATTRFSASGAPQEVENLVSAEKSAESAGDHQSVSVPSVLASSPCLPSLRTQTLGLVVPSSAQQQDQQLPVPSRLHPALTPSGHVQASSTQYLAPSSRLLAPEKSSEAPKVAQQFSFRVPPPSSLQNVPPLVDTFHSSPPTSSHPPFSQRTSENASEASNAPRSSQHVSASPAPPEISQTQPQSLLNDRNRISNSRPNVLAQEIVPEASRPPRVAPQTSAPPLLLRTPPTSLEIRNRSMAPSYSQPSPLPSPENAQNPSNASSAVHQYLDIVRAVFATTSSLRQPNAPSPSSCHFCSRAGHHLKSCMVLHRYLAQGKVCHNANGYLVLRSGSFIPRRLPGTCIRDRVDFLHRARSPLVLAPTTAVC